MSSHHDTEQPTTATRRTSARGGFFRRAGAALATAGAVAVGGVAVVSPATANAAGLQDNRLTVLADGPTQTSVEAVDLSRSGANPYAGQRLRVLPDGTVVDA